MISVRAHTFNARAEQRPWPIVALVPLLALCFAACGSDSPVSGTGGSSGVENGGSSGVENGGSSGVENGGSSGVENGGSSGAGGSEPPLVGPQWKASEITQFGITWTFDKEYDVGQFANGDYYVVGPVNIASVSPGAQQGRNGSQVNPHLASGTPASLNQPFDERASNYSSSTLFTGGPLAAGDSLVSTISRDDALSEVGWTGKNLNDAPKVKTSAVLSVLDAHPAELSFRPSYIKDKKTIYTVSQLDTSILKSVSLNGVTLPSHDGFDTVEYFLRGFERPWTFIHGYDWTARSIVPILNSYDYHETVGLFWSEASLLLLTNWDELDVQDKSQLVYRLVQTGIDYYAAVSSSGARTSYEWAWPMVFTGRLLNDPAMYRFWVEHPDKRTQRGHEKFYYVGDRGENLSSSIVPQGETWVGWKTPSGKFPAFAKQVGEEYEHLHPSEWTCHSPHCKAEVYRAQHDVYPLIGMILASILVDQTSPDDVNALLAHDPIRDYCDRWMNEGFMTEEYQNTGHTFLEEMEQHTSFTIYHYRYGHGGSKFVDEMWTKYR